MCDFSLEYPFIIKSSGTSRSSIAITLSHAPLNFRNPCYFDFCFLSLRPNFTGFCPCTSQQPSRCCNVTSPDWKAAAAACDGRCRNFPLPQALTIWENVMSQSIKTAKIYNREELVTADQVQAK